ncbi:S-layer homology domain-containing protein [Phosphitispora fastidiosa]|uniref:S-layer homology domain-containing protein n=1 Tax=Phosphitispora fastidiosa TaxID=2837202 RepID=UPI001E3E9035|nr:S-layer homology domain-containing protein [Phosphitispora fastidiosa]MBU7008129.1 hypothetical protein [Phosphitispora fastidiosa]
MRRTKLVSLLTGFSFMASCFLTTGFSFSYVQEFNLPPVISESLPDPFPFPDAKGNWAEAAIAEMYVKGVINGYQDSTFKPNRPVTMLEAVVILGKMSNYEPSEFDLESNKYLQINFNIPDWAIGYVAMALKQDLLLYSELQKASLQQPLTREEAAVFAVRSLGLAKQARKKTNTPLPFSDSQQIEEDIRAYVSIACEYKIMNGFPDGRFQPDTPLSRAEMAVVLSNIALHLNSDSITGSVENIAIEKDLIYITDAAGDTCQVKLPGHFLVYLNGKPAVIEQLTPGNYIRVNTSEDNTLTVIAAQSIVPDNGVPVSIKPVSKDYSFPELQQWADTNKASENYLTAIFDSNLYFLVTRGEKKTGGYTVDITKISSVSDEKGITYRVWTTRADPAKSAMVIEVITYPYAMVKIPLSEQPLNSVIFVDEFNQILAEITID